MGCSECYQSFLDEVSGRLPAMHRGMFHIGRTPAGAYIGSMRAKRLEEMEKSLKALVDSEDYEKAAKLRDEMKKLAGGEVEV